MSNPLGPLDIDCDALPYPIVRACQTLGFRNPLDVRWRRSSLVLPEANEGAGFFNSLSWLLFVARNQSQGRTCSCGKPRPALAQYRFQFTSGDHVEYLLGQCGSCGTMFWDEVAPSWSPPDYSNG